MPTDVRTPELVINKLSKQQYDNIQNPSDTELYLVPEDEELDPHRVIEFQAPTAENNYTWYRKYTDGWVEQGGEATIPARSGQGGSSKTVYLPVTMANTHYNVNSIRNAQSAYFAQTELIIDGRYTNRIIVFYWSNANATANAQNVCWEVKGMYATE